MRGFAQRAVGTEDQHRALRLHLRKYRLTASQRRRLTTALGVLDEATQGLLMALDETGDGMSASVDLSFKAAVRLLVFGPSGEFR